MDSPIPQTETTSDERVTTEPQRQALDAMSQELVNKLNVMVAEQEQRAEEFAARQHSLSSLPRQTVPSAFPTPPAPSERPAMPSANIFSPESLADVSQATGQIRNAPMPGHVAGGNLASPGRPASSPQPPVQSPLTGLTRPTDSGDTPDVPPPGTPFPPSGGSFPSLGQEEGKGISINAGTLIVILLIGLVMLRSCGS